MNQHRLEERCVVVTGHTCCHRAAGISLCGACGRLNEILQLQQHSGPWASELQLPQPEVLQKAAEEEAAGRAGPAIVCMTSRVSRPASRLQVRESAQVGLCVGGDGCAAEEVQFQQLEEDCTCGPVRELIQSIT